MEKILVFCSDKAFVVGFFSIFHDIPYRFRIDLKVVSAHSTVSQENLVVPCKIEKIVKHSLNLIP